MHLLAATTYDYSTGSGTSYGSGTSGTLDPTVAIVLLVIYVAVIVIMLASLWKVFVKAGKPGWAALVPIYNTYIMLQIAGRPAWWLLLLFVPIVNFVEPISYLFPATNYSDGISVEFLSAA